MAYLTTSLLDQIAANARAKLLRVPVPARPGAAFAILAEVVRESSTMGDLRIAKATARGLEQALGRPL